MKEDLQALTQSGYSNYSMLQHYIHLQLPICQLQKKEEELVVVTSSSPHLPHLFMKELVHIQFVYQREGGTEQGEEIPPALAVTGGRTSPTLHPDNQMCIIITITATSGRL